MIFPAPFQSSPLKVQDQWIDYNGHFNMAYYNVLFDDAADQMFQQLGLGADYVRSRNCSYFTLEAHLTYLRELHAQDVVLIENQLLDFDQKRVHYVQRMMHYSERWESCVSEVIVSHVDLIVKKPVRFLSKFSTASVRLLQCTRIYRSRNKSDTKLEFREKIDALTSQTCYMLDAIRGHNRTT
jgi:acyl-CoA thioester hydrolase